MMIAAVCKVQCGVKKLCKRGRSNGRRDYESSSMCAGHNYFKLFVPEASCCFGGKSGGVGRCVAGARTLAFCPSPRPASPFSPSGPTADHVLFVFYIHLSILVYGLDSDRFLLLIMIRFCDSTL